MLSLGYQGEKRTLHVVTMHASKVVYKEGTSREFFKNQHTNMLDELWSWL